MKALVRSTLVALGLILLGLWSPWLHWDIPFTEIFGVEEPDPIAGLQVVSLSGTITVTVDGQEGKAEPDIPLFLSNVTPGEQLVQITRESSVDGAYYNFSKLVDFEENAEVVISINLGPEEEFSEWHIITPLAKDTPDTEVTNLSVEVNQPEILISIGTRRADAESGKAETTIQLNEQQSITVEKNGFESQTFTILPESQEDRDLLKDFDLHIEVHLMHQPVEVV